MKKLFIGNQEQKDVSHFTSDMRDYEKEKGINIGFDADGVLFDTESFQLSQKVKLYMKKHFGLDVSDISGYGIKDVFACDEKIEMRCWTHFVFSYSLLFRARLWVKETIRALRKQGNKVFIVTSKACALEKNYKRIVVRLLFRLSLLINGIHVDGIEYCSLKNSAEDKLAACKRNNIKVIVEDKKENIEKLSEELFVLCFDSRNNQGKYNMNVFRVFDFNEVYAILQRIIGKETSVTNDFIKHSYKSKEEKKAMNNELRKEYYEWLKYYYSQLPFNKMRIQYSERIISFFSKLYAPVFFERYKPIVIGRENLKHKNGVIFVCNHLCDKDFLLLLYGLYSNGVSWHPLIKKEILDEKAGILFSVAYSVFVERTNSKSRHNATQEMAKLLVNGYNILIFPEGTYNRTSNLLKIFSGVSHVYLSQVLQRPIINCALTKNYDVQPILKIDKPYVVSTDISIEEAARDSFIRLSALVEQTRNYNH